MSSSGRSSSDNINKNKFKIVTNEKNNLNDQPTEIEIDEELKVCSEIISLFIENHKNLEKTKRREKRKVHLEVGSHCQGHIVFQVAQPASTRYSIHLSRVVI